MDRKTIMILAACLAALFVVPRLVNKIYPPKPLPPGLTNSASAESSLSSSTSAAPASIQQAETATAQAQPQLKPSAPEELIELTNSAAHYTFSSHGGGLKQVELLHYPEAVSTLREHKSHTNRVATLNTFTPTPTLAVLDGPAVQGDGVFKLTRTGNGLRAEKELTNGLTLIKDFTVSTNYLLLATVRLENRSDNPLSLPTQAWFAGTATPMNARDDGSAVGVMWYNGAKAQDVAASFFSTRGFACMPRVPPAEFRGGTNVQWVAMHNQFFALALMPQLQEPAYQIVVRTNPLPRPAEEELTYRAVREPMGYTAELIYPAVTIAPHQAVQRQFTIFAGPKEYRTLATIAASLNNNIDSIMGYGGFFGFFSKALLLGMNALHQALGLPYGWVIIAITVIIKVVFWPLTQASTRSAKRMQLLQPQIKAL